MKRPLIMLLACALATAACADSEDPTHGEPTDEDSALDGGGRRGDAGTDGGLRADASVGAEAGRGSGRDAAVTPDGGDGGGAAPSVWKPSPGTSWQWQLSGELDTGVEAEMYDIDLFDTSKSAIAALHARGRRVVCYFDTAYEPYRPDESRLRAFRGNAIDGWPDQTWLDVRQPGVVAVMKERIALAAEKDCDGVEADDVDVATNDTGFPISKEDQRTFIRTLAREAHARGLSYGLKNALEDVAALKDEVDFAVNEQCFEQGECDMLMPLVRAGKAVFHVEYPQDDDETLEQRARGFCGEANRLNFDSLAKRPDLDAARFSCR